MMWRVAAVTIMSALLWHPAVAQPADMPISPAVSDVRPAGIGVRTTDKGAVYVDARGLTLYGLDIRNMFGRTGTPLLYCRDACAQEWEPLRAPPGALATVGAPNREDDEPVSAKGRKDAVVASDWTVVEGAQGPQYLYKNYHLVFTRKGDAPGSTAFDGAEELSWNTLKYVPPVPKLVAPRNITTKLVDSAYALADEKGRLLFAPGATGDCGAVCAAWSPFPAGLVSRGVGDWTVARGGDTAQWLYKGRPVFVAAQAGDAAIPPQAALLRP